MDSSLTITASTAPKYASMAINYRGFATHGPLGIEFPFARGGRYTEPPPLSENEDDGAKNIDTDGAG